MPDKKLTDSEIVKALEICGTYKGRCTDCPAFIEVDRSNCKKVLLGAVEIINRQNADLIDKEKQLQEALKSMAVNKTKVIDYEKEINRLQDKNKFLQERNVILRSAVDYHRKESEKLKEAYAVYEETAGLKQAKAEAYKEFAERLKANRRNLFNYIYSSKNFDEQIDIILKEMEGK